VSEPDLLAAGPSGRRGAAVADRPYRAALLRR